MEYKVLYRKYRPDSFDNVVGQQYTIKMLKNAITTYRHEHAYIFTGPRGTGKTSTAKIFAKALNCIDLKDGNPCNKCDACKSFIENPDIIEIDAASNNGVDQIRELINNVKLVPSNLKYKVYIIDEVHMLTESAFNALLLTLEEPPEHVVFILATTDIQRVPVTILSRCQRFDFKPISSADIENHLGNICKKEKIKITDDALHEIALISAGGLRDALGMLDQLSSSDEKITVDTVSSYFGSVSLEKIKSLIESISENDGTKLVNLINDVKKSGTNYAVFIEKLIDAIKNKIIDIKVNKIIDDSLSYNKLYGMVMDLNNCLSNININVDPYTLIEIQLLKYIDDSTEDTRKTEIIPEREIIEPTREIETKTETKKIEKVNKKEVINNFSFDIDVRINNTFSNFSKENRIKIEETWNDFMNFLLNEDRSFISYLSDIKILATSDKYILIQSKSESSNYLLNENIINLEKLYLKFSNEEYKFAAISKDKWDEASKEFAKYFKENKVAEKYKYIEEENQQSVDNNNSSNIDGLVDIFGDKIEIS
jgi:DNA polymerase-3 subunit gamma/tau